MFNDTLSAPVPAAAQLDKWCPELPAHALTALTPAERRTVALLAEGQSPSQIAVVFEVSLATIRKMITAAKRKSGARTTAHLVAIHARAEHGDVTEAADGSGETADLWGDPALRATADAYDLSRFLSRSPQRAVYLSQAESAFDALTELLSGRQPSVTLVRDQVAVGLLSAKDFRDYVRTVAPEALRSPNHASLIARAFAGTIVDAFVEERHVHLATGLPRLAVLSERQLDVVRLLAAGLRPSEIAPMLGISERQTRRDITNAIEELGVATTAELVGKAVGLIATKRHWAPRPADRGDTTRHDRDQPLADGRAETLIAAIQSEWDSRPLMGTRSVEIGLRRALTAANAIFGAPLSGATLELLERAASAMAYEMARGRSITSVEALRARIAPVSDEQPGPGRIPRKSLGNDTVRELLGAAVADVADLALRLCWFHGDFDTPTALTVFSTRTTAGRDSHALAVQGGMLPVIGIGTGSFDSFVINDIVELVAGTYHDPDAAFHDRDAIDEIVKVWGFKTSQEMALLNFERTFEQLIARDARQRACFAKAASGGELARAFPRNVVVQRLPHGPYTKRLGTPAGEIMAKDHPEMAAILARHGYRGVLPYDEQLRGPLSDLEAHLRRICDMPDADILQVGGRHDQAVRSVPRARPPANVHRYLLMGPDRAGVARRRIVLHALADDRLLAFDTVGFESDPEEALMLAEYAGQDGLRRQWIHSTLNERVKPGMLSATSPETRAGMRRLALLSNAVLLAHARASGLYESLSHDEATAAHEVR